jgi:hypothetical protein
MLQYPFDQFFIVAKHFQQIVGFISITTPKTKKYLGTKPFQPQNK